MFFIMMRSMTRPTRSGGVATRRWFVSQNAYEQQRAKLQQEIDALPETKAMRALETFLREKCSNEQQQQQLTRTTTVESCSNPSATPAAAATTYVHVMTRHQIRTTLDAALTAFCLHVEARIAALCGRGFYTIGPCGEELLAAAAFALQPTDSVALHYRHIAVNMARQLNQGNISLEQVILDRARGYAASCMDPVTGGVHCSIGSAAAQSFVAHDFIVTSTLASQCSPAVGRALGYSLLSINKRMMGKQQQRPVSFVTIGDGSVHNHHFWSAFHTARTAKHKGLKCPVVFGISENGLSISYKTKGYVNTLFENDPLVPLFCANGNDMMDVMDQTKQAVDYARKHSAPAVILYQGLARRFGHAATDRQTAYLRPEEIQSMADACNLQGAVIHAVECSAFDNYNQVRDRFFEIQQITRNAFVMASTEKKVNRADMLERVCAPLVPVARLPDALMFVEPTTRTGKRDVMRKHMTRVITESLEDDETVVYLGEDVRHGGYYVVTEGLDAKFPGRIIDFPPDETSLLGAAIGFAQLGLMPIVEIPYAKYLDCGADMFYELGLMYWLSAGQIPNGMILRLQGFDRGLFGGNFHTHNTLQHIPPGVDVVCFSNGEDYVRGFRHALVQAKAGRVVMLVDCTSLLNQRHLYEKDRGWECTYPAKESSAPMMAFDEVRRHGKGEQCGIITYGNGVVTALQARRMLVETNCIQSDDEVDIIDCPYLSSVPNCLHDIASRYDALLFADLCKEGPGSSVLSSFVVSLRNRGNLPALWSSVAAPRTYNPLGSMCTFLSAEDVVMATKELLSKI
jgi:2-oxoisovalerate dehydrogenase E1 component